MLKVLDLCSGIGGFPLGIITADLHHVISPVQFVERDTFCQSILHRWFPNISIHSDLETFHAQPGQYNIITAGFPCQPHSLAGSRNGDTDQRNLWPQVYRIITEAQPIGFILENVPGIRHSNEGGFLRSILRDIAEAGFDAEWGTTSVRALGGVHKRQRFFLIAYPQSERRTPLQSAIAAQERTDQTSGTHDNSSISNWTSVIAEAAACNDGLPFFLAGQLMTHADLPKALCSATVRATAKEVKQPLQAIGNAICPQQVGLIWKRLYECIRTA